MKQGLLLTLFVVTLASIAGAGNEPAKVVVSLDERIGPMETDKFALGQGSLSPEPMWDNRIPRFARFSPASFGSSPRSISTCCRAGLILTEGQIVTLEKAEDEKDPHGGKYR